MATPENEKRTPVFDWEAGDFETDSQGKQSTATEEEAVKQIVIKALSTERTVFLIYANVEDPEEDHTYGNETAFIMTQADLPEDVRLSEIKRAITEALIYDEWIEEVYDIVLYRRDKAGGLTKVQLEDGGFKEIGTDELYADFWVRHIFGTTYMEGVNILNG